MEKHACYSTRITHQLLSYSLVASEAEIGVRGWGGECVWGVKFYSLWKGFKNADLFISLESDIKLILEDFLKGIKCGGDKGEEEWGTAIILS